MQLLCSRTCRPSHALVVRTRLAFTRPPRRAAPARRPSAGVGGPGLRLRKTVDRARRNLKPTTRPIFFCGRSRPNPFLDACHAIALQPNLQRSGRHWLVGWSTLRPRLTRHPASPRPHAANEENAALRKAIEDADYEYGVGLLRLNQLDWTSSPWSPRRRPSEEAQLCLHHRSNSSRNLDFLNAFASPLQVAKRSNCAFSTVRGQRLSPAVDNDSLEVTTSTRSRTRSSRRDGRCACHMRARRLDDAVDGPRAPQSGAAQQEQPPWLHDVNHTYHRTHLLLSAALHDLTPHLLSIASSGSPECRMRCAIAHF